MKLEAINNSIYRPKIEIIEIFPPTWNIKIQELRSENWENKEQLRKIYKYQDQFWEYMKNNNIISKDIIEEIE